MFQSGNRSDGRLSLMELSRVSCPCKWLSRGWIEMFLCWKEWTNYSIFQSLVRVSSWNDEMTFPLRYAGKPSCRYSWKVLEASTGPWSAMQGSGKQPLPPSEGLWETPVVQELRTTWSLSLLFWSHIQCQKEICKPCCFHGFSEEIDS